MQIGSISDLSQSYSMQTRNAKLKVEMQRLTQELSSGQVADVRKALGGNIAYVSDLDRSLHKMDGYDKVTAEAAHFVGHVQTALEHVSTLGSAFISTLLTSNNAGFGDTTALVPHEAEEALQSVIATLNTSVGGRALFGGIATDGLPLINGEDLAAALTGAVAGAGSVDDILTAAEDWFNDPSGFAAVAYRGSDVSLAPVSLSDEESANFDIRADDPALRDMLRAMTLAVVADDPALGLTEAEQTELFQKSTPTMIKANDAVIDLQAHTGVTERMIETVTARSRAERSALEFARSELLAADPYQSATELEAIQFQLQSLYAITSRMSQLSLVNFL